MNNVKRELVISQMINSEDFGFHEIVNSGMEVKKEILEFINKSNISLVTVKIFMDFINLKLKKKQQINMAEEMLHAILFCTNILECNPFRVDYDVTVLDMVESSLLKEVLRNG